MKIRSLFDMIQDSRDVADFFENVETTDQMVSRLERIKRQGAEELLACIEALRISVDSALEDTLEMAASNPGEDDIPDGEGGDFDLGDLGDPETTGTEDKNTEATPPAESKI